MRPSRATASGRSGRSGIADRKAAGRQAWCGARCDGNDDGNAGRRARFWLNGYAQLIDAKAVLTRGPLRLESERRPSRPGFESLQFRW